MTAGKKAGLYVILCLLSTSLCAQPVKSIDLARVSTASGVLQRVYGSVGSGSRGVPVAGGVDINDDGFRDYAFSSMQAMPSGRTQAGQVFLVLGDGTIQGEIDTAQANNRVLTVIGEQIQENAGSEIWMADVTGDGLGDLLICRQNYTPGINTPGERIGAGALSIIPGQENISQMENFLTCANQQQPIDLGAPQSCLNITTIVGANAGDRLCMWARTGDVTNDQVNDIAVGADRHTVGGDLDSGVVYVIRGGPHLVGGGTIDLADFGTTVLPGKIARIKPVPSPFSFGNPDTDTAHYHFGATLQIADLDGNGISEVIVAAALSRSGGVLAPNGGTGEGSGGTEQGTVYIAWDDNFAGDWAAAPDFRVNAGPGSHTIIDGGINHDSFGEEIQGGRDYDGDGNADLFIGDLTADGLGGIVRFNAGSGHVLYNAKSLKGKQFDFDNPPVGLTIASFLGPSPGAIAADTAMHGDFNGDGIDDLAFSSPNDAPLGRIGAGTLHVILGQDSAWPAVSDLSLSNFPDSSLVQIINVYGAHGRVTGDEGDMLAYSGSAGDLNDDGVDDLFINEMIGNGVAPGTVDVGNLIILDGQGMMDYAPPVSNELCFPVRTFQGSFFIICLD